MDTDIDDDFLVLHWEREEWREPAEPQFTEAPAWLTVNGKTVHYATGGLPVW